MVPFLFPTRWQREYAADFFENLWWGGGTIGCWRVLIGGSRGADTCRGVLSGGRWRMAEACRVWGCSRKRCWLGLVECCAVFLVANWKWKSNYFTSKVIMKHVLKFMTHKFWNRLNEGVHVCQTVMQRQRYYGYFTIIPMAKRCFFPEFWSVHLWRGRISKLKI